MKKILLKLIKIYQKSIFNKHIFFRMFYLSDKCCRFQPSCSNYCFLAIEKYGSIKGCWLCLKRIIRCHPWSKTKEDRLK